MSCSVSTIPRVPGELRPLVVAFNRVLELLHDAGLAQRRFVADAAHQMRTPVAGLLAQIELLQVEPRAAAIGTDLGKLQRAAQSMAHSANQLLSLARAEPLSSLQDEPKPVALDQLVHELVERHLERADQRGIDLGAETGPVSVMGSSWLLEDLLANLIDNALKYTPAGWARHGAQGTEGDRPFLEVEDDGPGIPEGERARVRERFYRSPGSPGIGAGLGLSIVEEIARAHDGDADDRQCGWPSEVHACACVLALTVRPTRHRGIAIDAFVSWFAVLRTGVTRSRSQIRRPLGASQLGASSSGYCGAMNDYVTTAVTASRRRRALGFSLLELMMVVAVAGILLAIAVPSFRSFMQNSRLSTQANTLVYSLNLARSSAVKLDTAVQVCASSDGANCNGAAWDQGWLVGYPAAANCATGGAPATVLGVSPQLGGGNHANEKIIGALAVCYLASGQTNNGIGGDHLPILVL